MLTELQNYVDSLFAAVPPSEKAYSVKSETFGRLMFEYNRLIAEGKTEEEAYGLAIASLGDIGAILSSARSENASEKRERRKLGTAIAVALYILCPVPVILIQNEWGVALMFIIIAFATALIIASSVSKKNGKIKIETQEEKKQNGVVKAICSAVWAIVFVVYFVLSFSTGAWYITWVVFLIGTAIEGMIKAVSELVGKDGTK